MAQCRVCGKKGLFLNLDSNDRCKDCRKILASAGVTKLEQELKHQDKLISVVQTAVKAYQKDGDIERLIAAYEKALIHDSKPLAYDSYVMSLVELYIKAGHYDKAWGYLNSLLRTHEQLTHKIRFAQCKILKKEQRYQEAMEMLMLGYLYKSKWNNTFQKEMFIKEATPISNKLKWPPEVINSIACIIEKQVKRNNYSEKSLIDTYRKEVAKS